ncbi:MAG: sensor histidine kinase [Proteobacteria bacterium]|nr:sensor histidine kinase [Pseudomonadota bacterium]
MRNIIPRHKGSDPVKLVWLITILSFCVGVFMVSIVWQTLTDIRIDREKLFRLKESFTSIRALHEKHLVQERLDLSSLLDGNAEAGAFPKTSQIFRLVEEYRKVAGTPESSEVFNQLEESLLTLANLRGKFTRWALDYNHLEGQLPISKKEVESILDQIEKTVEREEEKQWHARSARIRQFKQQKSDNAEQLIARIISDLDSSTDLSIIRRDIANLALLSERLLSITDLNSLADLKDDRLRKLLYKIRQNTKSSTHTSNVPKVLINRLLNDYETAMFGLDYSIYNEHQEIILGYEGLYGIYLDLLNIKNERERLRAEGVEIFDSVNQSLQKVTEETEIIAQQEATKVEVVLGQTWRTMFIIWLVTSLIYLLLAYEIIMTAKQQIKAIEDSNIELDELTKELQNSEDRLRRLSSELLHIQENERRRIAFELHDELGQSMAALKLQVGAISRKLGVSPIEKIQAECQEMRQNINDIIENVRRLARDLSPVVLDDLGLQAAIEYLVNNFSKLYNIDIWHKTTDINHLFDEESQRIIYRILQESLTNIGKHSQADNVSLMIEEKERQVHFIIRDNGKGFNVSGTLQKIDADRGMGLATMSERVRILGGKLDIQSRIGGGTIITFSTPI